MRAVASDTGKRVTYACERSHPGGGDAGATAVHRHPGVPGRPTLRRDPRCCVRSAPKCAARMFTCGTAVWPACRTRSSPGTCRRARCRPCAVPLRGLDGSTLREGDRVAFFDVHRTCGRCRACTVHRTPTRCAARRVYGITDSADEGLFGGWSQAIYLEPSVGIARLPDAVTLDDYIGGGCGLLTAVHVLERAALRPGDTVLVQGTGAVGLSAIALARLCGASLVLAIGAPASRLDLARRMGADHVFDVTQSTPAERLEQVRALTHDEGVDVGLEAAGAAPAIGEGLDLVRDGGRYVIAGHYTDAGDSAINAHRQINRKHLEIRGCWGSEPGHFLRALGFLERHAARGPVARDRHPDLSADRTRRGAGRRRSGCTSRRRSSIRGRPHEADQDRRHARARQLRPGRHRRPDRQRRRRLPAQLLARHPRVTRRGLPPRSATAAADAGRIVAIMQDLSGPKIRTTGLEGGGPLTLVEGAELRIRAGETAGREGLVFTPYAELVRSARPGDRLLLDDGRIELRVLQARERRARDLRGQRRIARRQQGDHRAGRRAAGVGGHGQGRRGPPLRPLARRRLRRAQLRADRRRPAPRVRHHGRRGRPGAADREDRAAGRGAEPHRDPGAGPGGDGGARRSRASRCRWSRCRGCRRRSSGARARPVVR